jgi:hypothetical protein
MLVEEEKRVSFPRLTLDHGSILLSLIAVVLSLVGIYRSRGEHHDSLSTQTIREAYSDFIIFEDIRTQYPLQSHIFETKSNYWRFQNIVKEAVTAKSNQELITLKLQEAAIAERIFVMFEHCLYQRNHAKKIGDFHRQEFLEEELNYYTKRLLCNPRLVWYWSPKGENFCEHSEQVTNDYYNQNIEFGKIGCDSVGPYIKQ